MLETFQEKLRVYKARIEAEIADLREEVAKREHELSIRLAQREALDYALGLL
jgi:hypothetical protein